MIAPVPHIDTYPPEIVQLGESVINRIAAGEVVEAGDASQYLSLRSFAATGGSEDEKGFDACGGIWVGHDFRKG